LNRRALLIGLCAAALAPAAALAQRSEGKRRIGYFGVQPPDSEATRRGLALFRDVLKRHALVEGRDYVLDYVWEERIERVPAKMRALAAGKVDLIVAITTPVALAARDATREIPIVFGTVSDPVGSGLVASLARPGGNITGVTNVLPELSGKLLELAREIVPGTRRIGAMWNPDNPAKALEYRALQEASAHAGIELNAFPVRTASEIERVLFDLGARKLDVLVTLAETLTNANRKRIAELALAARMPTVFSFTEHVRAGGLVSYSPDYSVLARRLAEHAGRILLGADPAALPVEQPTHFQLAVNLATARSLGLAIPQSVLLRANVVIE